MSTALTGAMFYTNLLPGKVLGVSSRPALPPANIPGRRTSKQLEGDVLWTSRSRQQEQELDTGYLPYEEKRYYSNLDDLYDAAWFPGYWSNHDAAAQYQIYAAILAAPPGSLLDLYA